MMDLCYSIIHTTKVAKLVRWSHLQVIRLLSDVWIVVQPSVTHTMRERGEILDHFPEKELHQVLVLHRFGPHEAVFFTSSVSLKSHPKIFSSEIALSDIITKGR